MPTKIYSAFESQKIFNNTSENSFSPEGLWDGSGHISYPVYLGNTSRPTKYMWRAIVNCTGTIGKSVEIFLAMSETGTFDANIPTGNYSFSEVERKRNLRYIGSILMDNDSDSGVAPINSVGGLVNIFSNYVSVVWFNHSGHDLGPDGNEFVLTPVPDEIQ